MSAIHHIASFASPPRRLLIHTDSLDSVAIIRGSKKIRADPVCRKLPLCPAHLQTFLIIAHGSGSYGDLLFATILSCLFYVVFTSSVQSGFLPPKRATVDRNRSRTDP
ncbi:hypothetical protein K443DRAFT_102612, partial [Laccaria amethystina LaAM-08-1]